MRRASMSAMLLVVCTYCELFYRGLGGCALLALSVLADHQADKLKKQRLGAYETIYRRESNRYQLLALVSPLMAGLAAFADDIREHQVLAEM